MSDHQNSLEKVAILLLSLGEELAGEVLSKLPRSEAQKVVQTLIRLRNVDRQTAIKIQQEFAEMLISDRSHALPDGAAFAKRVIGKSFDQDTAAQMISHLPPEQPQSFQEAELVDSKQLWRILSLEHPQTIALILANLSPKKSGEIVGLMHPQTRTDILVRLANIREIDQKALQDLDETFSKVLAHAKNSNSRQLGGPGKTAQILAFLNSEQRKHLLSEIESTSAELANEVKAGLFTFEDISKLDRTDVEKLLAKISPQDLELALRKCPEFLSELFFSAMSERRADQLRENIASTKPVPMTKVSESQRRIAAVAAELISSGQLRDPMEDAV